MRLTHFFIIICFLTSCNRTQNKSTSVETLEQINPSETIITFGSCNRQTEANNLWQHIVEQNPDLWIWLGDIIYSDTKKAEVLKQNYAIQKAKPGYQKLIAACPVIGIYDDHDSGQNDGGKDYAIKKESRDLLWEFLDIEKSNPIWRQEGGYSSHTFGESRQKVKVILLDTRYFRDELERAPKGNYQRYKPNPEGDVLGEEQWRWLENQLVASEAQVHIIGSSIQLVAEEHGFEKWSNFPKAHQRFYELIKKTKPKRPIILSGDRHIAEISKIELEGLDQPLPDITSSGMTHSYEKILEKNEPNKFRVSDKITGEKNYGVLKIDWNSKPVSIIAEIRGLENKLILEEKLY